MSTDARDGFLAFLDRVEGLRVSMSNLQSEIHASMGSLKTEVHKLEISITESRGLLKSIENTNATLGTRLSEVEKEVDALKSWKMQVIAYAAGATAAGGGLGSLIGFMMSA